MNKLFKRLILALLLVNAALWSIPSHALLITANDDTATLDDCLTCSSTLTMWSGSDGVSPYQGIDYQPGGIPNLGETEIGEIIGLNAAFEYLTSQYKSDVEGVDLPLGVDSGPQADNYNTWFNNTGTDPSGSLTIGSGISCGNCFLYVKDGNNDPHWYVFDISGWAGDDINLTNFWPVNGAISHVEILTYNNDRGIEQPVPEPSISALLGIGLLGMIGVSRRRKV